MGEHLERAMKARPVPWNRDWKVEVWPCHCGVRHAPWWRTTPPPSHGDAR